MWRQRKRFGRGMSAAGIDSVNMGTPQGIFGKVFKIKVKVYPPVVYDPAVRNRRQGTGNSLKAKTRLDAGSFAVLTNYLNGNYPRTSSKVL